MSEQGLLKPYELLTKHGDGDEELKIVFEKGVMKTCIATGRNRKLNLQFVDVSTLELADSKRMRARCKLWNLMEKTLDGPTRSDGPYYYLTTKFEQYDVAALSNDLTRIVDTPTILSHAQELEVLFTITYKQRSGSLCISF